MVSYVCYYYIILFKYNMVHTNTQTQERAMADKGIFGGEFATFGGLILLFISYSLIKLNCFYKHINIGDMQLVIV